MPMRKHSFAAVGVRVVKPTAPAGRRIKRSQLPRKPKHPNWSGPKR